MEAEGMTSEADSPNPPGIQSVMGKRDKWKQTVKIQYKKFCNKNINWVLTEEGVTNSAWSFQEKIPRGNETWARS